MAKNIIITINAKSNAVKVNSPVVGAIGENMQGVFIVEFVNSEYISGVCWLEINSDGEKGYIELKPSGDNTYTAPIKSGITKYRGNIEAQVRITQTAVNSEVPVFKSDIFSLNTLASINALDEMPDEYPKWIDVANAKLAEVDEAIENLNDGVGCVFYVKPQSKADGKSRTWDAVSATRFKTKISSTEFNLTKPYIDDVIVFNEKGTGEKTILETLNLINGDIVIYSNLEIDCKIILKGVK